MLKELLRYFPHTTLYTFSWNTPPPFRAYVLYDDPKVIHNKETSKIKTFFFTKFVYESLFCGILKKITQMRI